MTYLVKVASTLAESVEIPNCSRVPRVGEQCKVIIDGVVINFGKILAVEEVKE